VSGWLLLTGVEKGPLAQAIAGAIPQASRIFNEGGWTGGERRVGLPAAASNVASNQKGGQFCYQSVWNCSPVDALVSASSRRNKIIRGQQTALSACVHEPERTKAIKHGRLVTALKRPALPRPCVLTISVSSRRSQHTDKGQPQLVHSSLEGDLESVQVTSNLAQTFPLLYRRLVPQGVTMA
jgi:hypothetical protein